MGPHYFVIFGVLLFVGLVAVGYALALATGFKRGDVLSNKCLDQVPGATNMGLVQQKESQEKREGFEQVEATLKDGLAHSKVVKSRTKETEIATPA
jgi:hypothetical protein